MSDGDKRVVGSQMVASMCSETAVVYYVAFQNGSNVGETC